MFLFYIENSEPQKFKQLNNVDVTSTGWPIWTWWFNFNSLITFLFWIENSESHNTNVIQVSEWWHQNRTNKKRSKLVSRQTIGWNVATRISQTPKKQKVSMCTFFVRQPLWPVSGAWPLCRLIIGLPYSNERLIHFGCRGRSEESPTRKRETRAARLFKFFWFTGRLTWNVKSENRS